jgi:hypothetical protein
MIIGTQFFLAGFIGEIVLRERNSEVHYKIRHTLNLREAGKKEEAV